MGGRIFTVLFWLLLAVCVAAGAMIWRLWRRDRLLFRLQERKLRDLERSMELQHRQYTELGQQMEQMRKFRHDLRHHEAMLQSYVRQGNLEGLEEYMQGYSALRLDTPMRFCANAAVDALAQQYLGMAREQGVEMDAALEVGEAVGIATPDLCVVLGNCLENAVEAAQRAEEGNRCIKIRVMETQGWLSIVQENGCPPGALREAEGGYLSSKSEGRVGIGLMSVLSVAEQYGGTAAYQMRDGKFRTSVILFKRDESI